MSVIVFDGTLEGFLTAVFDIYLHKLEPTAFLTAEADDLVGDFYSVKTEEIKARRVLNGILKKVGRPGLYPVFLALRSDDEKRYSKVFDYVKLVLEVGMKINVMKADQRVIDVESLVRKVNNELHRLKGFVRFAPQDGFYVAHYAPKNDITELLLPYFTHRMSPERFALIDEKRMIAGVFDGRAYGIIPVLDLPKKAQNDETTSLWQDYYRSVTIESRKNSRLMIGYMPKYYWDNVNEFDGDPTKRAAK